ncbi:MSMEG_0565 family glycosyltransferase [Methylobrevis albus]|uniref:MSMEG_0565 family glycosyltransferase n=1 Tax=Methylobrevis albus TaxID=2793297 RepID=A0A931MWM5_9HYPH|nr:MSMEG_0565 family glycosyltransferase [Methylobrevis albus]MBH0237368.1 MSMEG_0565 family glycosyltransferase [Methylobrevis albus]
MPRPLKIALLAHSTNPRGGVVHALELGDALAGLGHMVTVHAPDPAGRGFFRETRCRTRSVAATTLAPGASVTEMVRRRAGDYVAHFEDAANRGFDVYHAQDGISANALATLKERGVIPAFARTVHHVDAFADPALQRLQLRAITAADELFVVSDTWRDLLARDFGRAADNVGNGVDRARFSARPDESDRPLRDRLGLAGAAGPVLLAIGGIEARKNTLQILEAFLLVRARRPEARLVIAGGASLLDHDAYRAAFLERLAATGLPEGTVIVTGPLRQGEMPALYRLADVLLFPSVKEGFGLVVLEAMAAGVPVVTSAIPPFTEYLGERDVAWCDPACSASIAAATMSALAPEIRRVLVAGGDGVAAQHGWWRTARAHLGAYHRLAGLAPCPPHIPRLGAEPEHLDA